MACERTTRHWIAIDKSSRTEQGKLIGGILIRELPEIAQ
jgi:hypothetical protein